MFIFLHYLFPDTFNSGVMVLTPSLDTYKELIHLNKINGSLDGGEQGILNERFCPDWAQDSTTSSTSTGTATLFSKSRNNMYTKIPKCGRLPFIYNVAGEKFEHYKTNRYMAGLSEPVVAHLLGDTKPWKLVELEKKKNFNINNLPISYRNDLPSQAKLHQKWRELYYKATGDKSVLKNNRILVQFLN